MNEKEIQTQYEQILRLLKQKRLKEAQTQLTAFLADSNDYSLQTRLEEVKTSYSYMLGYVKQGIDDPTRSRLLRTITTQTAEICHQAYLIWCDRTSESYYHNLRRQYRGRAYEPARWLAEVEACRSLLSTGSEEEQAVMQRHERVIRTFFLATWANSAWQKADAEAMQQWLASDRLQTTDRQLAVSAVTLSLLEFYDAAKMEWLMEACKHEELHTRQRALTGLFLTLCLHEGCFAGYPALEARLLMLCDSKEVLRLFSHIALQLVQSLDVDDVNRRMQEEILPEMMKDMRQKFRNLKEKEKRIDEFELDESDLMPDWEHFTDGKMGEKIREMSELQMKGADLNYGTFAQMKQHTFFQEPFHWLYPFDPRVASSFGCIGQDSTQFRQLLDMTLRTGIMCDGDKYSLCFMLAAIGGKHGSHLSLSTLTQGLFSAVETSPKGGKNPADNPDLVINYYIQDLYRFYKLCPQRKQLRNPFQHPWRTAACVKLMKLTGDFRWVKPLADYLFEQRHYGEAASAYALADQQSDAELCARQGYCHQRLGDYEQAIAHYRQADLLQPDHLWTITQLATCYRRVGRYEEALAYYRQVDAVQPAKSGYLYHLASCLMQLERYEEALPYLYRLDLQDGHSLKTWRAIVWCSLHLGKEESAANYLRKLLEEAEPEAADYLCGGHLAWLQANEAQAVELYHTAAERCSSYDEFYQAMQRDYLRLLETKGMTRNDLALLMDAAL